MSVADKPQPWDRLPDETPLAFGVFVTFRDLGPSRTLPEVSRVSLKSLPNVARWSKRHRSRRRPSHRTGSLVREVGGMSDDLRNLAGWLVWGALAAVAWVMDVVDAARCGGKAGE